MNHLQVLDPENHQRTDTDYKTTRGADNQRHPPKEFASSWLLVRVLAQVQDRQEFDPDDADQGETERCECEAD